MPSDLIQRLESGGPVTDEEVLLALGWLRDRDDKIIWRNPLGEIFYDDGDDDHDSLPSPISNSDCAMEMSSTPLTTLESALNRMWAKFGSAGFPQNVLSVRLPRFICAAALRAKEAGE